MSARGAIRAWVWHSFEGKRRRASHRLTLEHLGDFADHAGYVRGYSRRQLGRTSGVCERQAVNIVRELERAGTLSTSASFTPRGQQLTNVYRILAPWIVAMLEGEARAAEVPSEPEAPARVVRAHAGGERRSDHTPPDLHGLADYWQKVNQSRFPQR